MINSMTGYGRGEGIVMDIGVMVEMRSLNNRFLEVSVRTPRKLSPFEDPIRELIQKEFSRGKIDIQIQINENKRSLTRLHVNKRVIEEYEELIEVLRQKFSTGETVSLGHLLSLPDLFISEEYPQDHDKFWAGLSKVILKAVTCLKAAQRKEGSSLIKDLKKRIRNIQRILKEIIKIVPKRRKILLNTLKNRVRQLVNDQNVIKKDRLELEVALLAEKSDITEECVRLQSHLELFSDILLEGGPVGKRLDFVLQEMNRESNTMGAKANSFDISHSIVDIKSEIERLKEQVRNLV